MLLTIVHLCDFLPVVPGTFLDVLLQVAGASRERLGARTLFVFPPAVAGRPWRTRIEKAGMSCIFAAPDEAAERLQPEIAQRGNVILHSHFVSYDLAAFLLKIRAPRTRLVVHLHSYPERTSWQQHGKDLLKVRLLGRWLCDRVIAVSKSVEASARQRGFPSDRLVVIENAINLGRFTPDPARRSEARARFGLDERAIVALLLGRDPVLKGADLYLEAAQNIVLAGGEGVFCLVGGEETRAFVGQRPKLGTKLRLLEPVADFESLLNAVDIFVSASRREGLPYAVLEAMACERLVIAAEIEGTSESYGRSDGVWLFPVGRADRLTDLLKRALDLAEVEHRSLGRANRVLVEAHYPLERWVGQVIGVYEEILSS